MNEDITKELPMSDSEKLNHVLTMSRNIVAGMNQLDARLTALENELVSLKAGTNPFWQIMHDQQAQMLVLLQDQTGRIERLETPVQQQAERMDRIEAQLQQQDAKSVVLGEKIEVGFRKLGDKLDQLVLDYYEVHTEVRDLHRRVTRLEPVN